MFRVVLDTNIKISATIANGNEFKILQSAKQGKCILLTSSKILEEFRGVISRKKFGFGKDVVDSIMDNTIRISTIVEPKEKLNIIKEDPSDNRFLECAIAGKADFLISGDEHLLALKEFRGIKIIKSSEFLRILKYR